MNGSDTTNPMVTRAVYRAKLEILEDMAGGRVPEDISTFGQLHDYVDANEYGGLCEDDVFTDDNEADMAFANEVQEQVHQWLVAGRPQPTRAEVIAEAEFATAQYPQYRGHWDGEEWTLVRFTAWVRTKSGVAFVPGDVTVAKRDGEYPTAYSRRNKIDTSVRNSDFMVISDKIISVENRNLSEQWSVRAEARKQPPTARHGRVQSRWSGEYGQVAACTAESIEIIMDSGETATVTDEANAADWVWLGDEKRTILVHLNIEVPADDERNADEIGDKILAALEVGLEGAPGDLASGAGGLTTTERLTVTAPLVEEV